MGIDLPLIWALIIGFGVMMYVLMDGFDLGIGILYPFIPDRHHRDVAMNTVAPVWDGNETWLVLGGAGLLAAFPLFTGVALVFAYALLGSTWLIMKTEGELQFRMFHLTRPLMWILLAAIGVISVWTPLRDPAIAERWFSFPNLIWFSPVPLLVVGAALLMQRALARGRSVAPFLLALLLMFLGYAGLAISGWPNILPPNISIWEAAAPPQSLGFALVGALLIIPFILMYTAFAYYVFRGKVRPGDGYH